jgi:hypothetical protein
MEYINAKVPEIHTTKPRTYAEIMNELLLIELALLTPEDAALVRKMKCPACGTPKLDRNPNCGHDYRSMSFIRALRLFRICPAIEAESSLP